MEETIGRREANRRATREAVEAAARTLFAAKGYEATSVREIADAAGVAERTLYRYFDGKEGLLAAEVQRWIDTLVGAIATRPDSEPPLVAVQRAVIGLADSLQDPSRAQPTWMFSANPRLRELMQKSAVRPMLRFEQAITEALLSRAARAGGGARDEEAAFAVEVAARASVAVIRSVAIRRRDRGPGEPATFAPLLRQGFAALAAEAASLTTF